MWSSYSLCDGVQSRIWLLYGWYLGVICFHVDAMISFIELSDETRRAYKRRPCKSFFTKKGCAHGVICHFLHHEEPNPRHSVAIRLDPGCDGGSGGIGNGQTLRPSNWKTRICNKWEFTGYCPYGSKCNFAHGMAELQPYHGGP